MSYDSFQDTMQHIERVRYFLDLIGLHLEMRGLQHDQSKFEDSEKSIFDEYTPKLKECTYGSNEYKEYLKEMKVALDHHYKNNRHHPEYFENGISGMNLIDLIEMFCDWKAASERHSNGDLNKSIEINEKRFNLDPQIVSIFKNSVNLFREVENENLPCQNV